jgi:hypothetical protein
MALGHKGRCDPTCLANEPVRQSHRAAAIWTAPLVSGIIRPVAMALRNQPALPGRCVRLDLIRPKSDFVALVRSLGATERRRFPKRSPRPWCGR